MKIVLDLWVHKEDHRALAIEDVVTCKMPLHSLVVIQKMQLYELSIYLSSI